MKSLTLAVLAILVSACGFLSPKGQREIVCMTPFGPLQSPADDGVVEGMDDSDSQTYTVSLPSGVKITIHKSSCVVLQEPPPKKN